MGWLFLLFVILSFPDVNRSLRRPHPPNNAEKEINPVHSGIAKLIKDHRWGDDKNKKYSTFVDKLTGDTLLKKIDTMHDTFNKFPVRIEYKDVVDSNIPKQTVYLVIKVTPWKLLDLRGGFKYFADFECVIAPLNKAKGNDKNSEKVYKALTNLDFDSLRGIGGTRSGISIIYSKNYRQYIGEGHWITVSGLGIEPGFAEKGVIAPALRMLNTLYKLVGVNTAFIKDAAKFPCNKYAINKFYGSEKKYSGDFGKGRVIRLFQEKKDVSIYQRGGYEFTYKKWNAHKRYWMDIKQKVKPNGEQVKIDMNEYDKLTKVLSEYTVDNFVNHDFEQRKTGWFSKKKKVKEYILLSVPEAKRSPLDTTYKLTKTLGDLYDNNCAHYYQVMGFINRDNNWESEFRVALKAWIVATQYLKLDNIQKKTFNKEYYEGVNGKIGRSARFVNGMNMMAYGDGGFVDDY
eukprot:405140_1